MTRHVRQSAPLTHTFAVKSRARFGAALVTARPPRTVKAVTVGILNSMMRRFLRSRSASETDDNACSMDAVRWTRSYRPDPLLYDTVSPMKRTLKTIRSVVHSLLPHKGACRIFEAASPPSMDVTGNCTPGRRRPPLAVKRAHRERPMARIESYKPLRPRAAVSAPHRSLRASLGLVLDGEDADLEGEC
jgi:hypothetical protein